MRAPIGNETATTDHDASAGPSFCAAPGARSVGVCPCCSPICGAVHRSIENCPAGAGLKVGSRGTPIALKIGPALRPPAAAVPTSPNPKPRRLSKLHFCRTFPRTAKRIVRGWFIDRVRPACSNPHCPFSNSYGADWREPCSAVNERRDRVVGRAIFVGANSYL